MQLPGMDFADLQDPPVSTNLNKILSWEIHLYTLRKKSKKF